MFEVKNVRRMCARNSHTDVTGHGNVWTPMWFAHHCYDSDLFDRPRQAISDSFVQPFSLTTNPTGRSHWLRSQSSSQSVLPFYGNSTQNIHQSRYTLQFELLGVAVAQLVEGDLFRGLEGGDQVADDGSAC